MSTEPRVMIDRVEMVPISELKLHPKNRNQHPEDQIKRLARILEYQGFRYPVKVSKRSGYVTSGHGRIEAAKKNKWTHVPVSYQDYESDEQEYADLIADNSIASWAELDLSGINMDIGDLGPDFDIELLGIRDFSLDYDKPGDGERREMGSLSDEFIVPPFSVLDQRQGYWRARKQQWLSLGIKSEVGRDGNLLKMSETVLANGDDDLRDVLKNYKEMLKRSGTVGGSLEEKIPGYYLKKNQGMSDEQIVSEFISNSTIAAGTSIFDPVLCELAYRWFSPRAGVVLDPFAGGSVRGVVASKLGRTYVGCELRQEQVDANREQANEICTDPLPAWACGDSRQIDKHCAGVRADLLFSCPPYHDLEVYSDGPADISAMNYADFLSAYREIIAKSAAMLKENRFAVWVITEIRDKRPGLYKHFVPDTIQAFEDAGLGYYNEMILVAPVGTTAIRTPRMFRSSRKVGRMHQNVLVFCKGDPEEATRACGEVEINLPIDALLSEAASQEPIL